MRPVIGLTTSFLETGDKPPRLRTYLNAAYTDAVFAAGGIPQPVPIPPRPDQDLLDALLACYDGLIFTGGYDLHPTHYGEALHPKADLMHERRNAFEVALFRRADAAQKPILAICLGHQVAHVARGGKLVQHVDDLKLAPPIAHHSEGGAGVHGVRIAADSLLARIVGKTEIEVNSRHHQAIDTAHPGIGLRAVATSPDGLLEASEAIDNPFLLTVQWHPEDMIDRPEHLALFEALVDHCRKTARPATEIGSG